MARIDDLKMLRTQVIATLEAAEPREVAQLSRELRALAAEIDSIERAAPKRGSLVDELSAKRDALRVADAKGGRPAERSGS